MTALLEMERELNLKRKYTAEEREAMYEAIAMASETGDSEEEERLVMLLPLHPRLAKIVAKVNGKQHLLEHFNISHADEVFGEGWLDAYE